MSAQRVFITGATSGIGRELAKQYAQDGAHVGVVGRREDQLLEAAREARNRGARVETYVEDVCDGPAMAAAARHFAQRAGGVDLVVANAGMAVPDRLDSGDAGPLVRLMDVNIDGVLNTLLPFVPLMKEQGGGHLVAVASIAGARALPGHTGYAATKMAVRCLMDGFAYDLERWGIRTTTINPGFVVSEITDKNEFPMPFMLPTDEAVRRMRRAIARGRRVYSFPAPMAFATWLLTWLPRPIVSRLRFE